MALCASVDRHDRGDVLGTVAEAVPHLIPKAEVQGPICAGNHERADPRMPWRNGYRRRDRTHWLAAVEAPPDRTIAVLTLLGRRVRKPRVGRQGHPHRGDHP